MPTIDPMTVATRFFNTPLFVEPGKAAILSQVLGPRLLGVEAGAVELVGVEPDADGAAGRHRPRAGSLIADGLFQVVRDRRSYSLIEGVAVIPVIGSLVRRGSYVGQSMSGGTSYEGVSAQIRAAVEDRDVRAIALEIDSFGGEAIGCFALAEDIRRARAVKPVEAFLAEFACSAGYMIAAQADRITIPEFGLAGSIGVVMMHAELSGKYKREGVQITLIHSGVHKVDGNPFEALDQDVLAKWQQECDAMRGRFAQEVALGRGARLSMQGALATEAQCYEGRLAVEAGLADAVAEARDAFGAFVERVQAPPAPRRMTAAALAPGADVSALALAAPQIETVKIAASTAGLARLSEWAAGPSTGATAPISKESDMPKDVDKSGATPPAQEAVATTEQRPATLVAEPEQAQSAPAAASMDWILERCDRANLSLAVARKMVTDGLSREQVLDRIIDLKAERAEDGGEIRPAGHARVTADGRDRMREGMSRALLAKAGMEGGERNEFSSMSLREMARASLTMQGIAPKGGSMEFAGAVFAPMMASGGMHSTSDFANILVDVANKAMLRGFEETEESYQRFTSVGTMTDFKPHKRIGLDSFPALTKVEEGAEFTYGTMADHAETAVLATYGKLFAITRQTIINDDLDAFTRIPTRMGRAARRTVGDLVFAVLTGNPNMSDRTALFHADHGNLAGAGARPSETSVNAAITAMMTQKDRSENATALNIQPAFGIFPPKWRAAAMQTLNSEYAPDDTEKAGTAKMPRAYNTAQGAFEPIFDARLTGDAWFVTADPSVHDVIEVGYLDGNPAPFLEQQDGWSVDGTEFKVRIDATATPLAWQTLYKNPGS